MMLKQDNVYGAATCASRDNDLSNVNELPPHLVKLPQGRWALWRCMGLRGAGFPISELAKISTPVCAHAADVVLNRENEMRQARSEAIAALMGMLEPGKRYHKGAMRKVMRRVRQRQPLDLDDKLASVPALAEFNRAVAQLDTALANYREAFKEDNSRLSEGIRSSASAGRFREAVIWQNHPAFHNTIQSLLAEPSDAEKGRKQKRREEVVASYLQRYCTKNDTIGFFGPVGWANFVDRDELVTVQAGPGLIASRQVYFEGWCIDALAQEFSAQKGVRPYLAPRLRPSVRCEGATLRLPFSGQLKIAPDHAAILQACDGTRSAKQIAEDLIADPFTSFRDEQSINSVLDFLFSRKLIFWGFHTPIEAHPELTLRRYLEQIGDSKVRESSLAILDEVIAARNAVSAACGFAEELDRAMINLNEIFTRVTNSAATRSKHHTYARALVYEDCRRDIKLEIGNGLLQELASPLHLALKSARWLTARAFEICRVYFKTIFKRLAVANQEHRVDIASFWMEIQQLAQEERGPQHDQLIGDFQERWSRVMAIPEEQRHVQYSTAELQQKVNEQFYTADDVAKYVRYHSPDLMIASKSAEALRRGEYRFVLGELHAAVNTLSYLCFLEQHPAPEEFASAWNADIPECRVLPVLPKTFFGGAMRTKLLAATPRDFFLDFANDSPDPNPRAVPFAEFFIEESGDGLVVRSFDGRFEFDAMQFFTMAVVAMVTNCFKIANRERHVPRVSIDRLVVCRESWSFVTSELEFANESDEAARFLAIRRWAKGHEMPRHVFVTSPCERKPFYVDFDSIIYIDLFAKVVRRTARENPNDRVVLSEMLPGPEDLWLPDAEDNRYTSEFRIVALDLAGWTNPNSRQQPQMSELAIN